VAVGWPSRRHPVGRPGVGELVGIAHVGKGEVPGKEIGGRAHPSSDASVERWGGAARRSWHGDHR
jgi:hypothetical protein